MLRSDHRRNFGGVRGVLDPTFLEWEDGPPLYKLHYITLHYRTIYSGLSKYNKDHYGD